MLLVPVLLGLVLSSCRTAEFTPVQTCLIDGSAASVSTAATPEPVTEILVTYQTPAGLLSSAAAQEIRSLQARSLSAEHDLETVHSRSGLLPDVFSTDGDAEEMAALLEADPRVQFAIPNFPLRTLSDVNCMDEQWNLSGFGVPEAWGSGPGRHEVVVAVIDSGIDVDHPELKEAMLPGWNFFDMTADPRPGLPSEDDHGTHVSGIIAARGYETVTGVAGFPGNVRILPIRIFDDTGLNASLDDLILALAWAAGLELNGSDLAEVPRNPHPARLINLSIGAAATHGPNVGVDTLISQLTFERGITVVAASGNDGAGAPITVPGNSARAIAVGSVDADYHRSTFSSYAGPKQIGVMAPGGFGPSSCEDSGVLSTFPDGQVGCSSGTSMAAPFVTGALALLLTHSPGLTPAQLEASLDQATYFDPAFMTVEEYGAGVLCVDRLLSGRNPRPDQAC